MVKKLSDKWLCNKDIWTNKHWLFALLISTNHSLILDATITHSRTQHTGTIKTIATLIISLTYFDDAELAKNPIIFDKKVTWSKVKKRMVEVVQKHF
jgi:hypothetical protein